MISTCKNIESKCQILRRILLFYFDGEQSKDRTARTAEGKRGDKKKEDEEDA